MWIFKQANIGEFQEKEYGKYFTYRLTKDSWAIENGLLHEIDVLDGVRYATVKKTRAYVATDVTDDNKPILERWEIKNHLYYRDSH